MNTVQALTWTLLGIAVLLLLFYTNTSFCIHFQ